MSFGYRLRGLGSLEPDGLHSKQPTSSIVYRRKHLPVRTFSDLSDQLPVIVLDQIVGELIMIPGCNQAIPSHKLSERSPNYQSDAV